VEEPVQECAEVNYAWGVGGVWKCARVGVGVCVVCGLWTHVMGKAIH